MLDKLITYIVWWYKTVYQVLSVAWTNRITTRRDSDSVILVHTMGIYFEIESRRGEEREREREKHFFLERFIEHVTRYFLFTVSLQKMRGKPPRKYWQCKKDYSFLFYNQLPYIAFIQNIFRVSIIFHFSRVLLELIYFYLIFGVLTPLSAISWRPVLVVEEAGVPGENHRPWASNW